MTTWLERVTAVVETAAPPQVEEPAVVRRRRIVVVIGGVLGALLLGISLTREPGDASFYWLTAALAAVWAIAALVSGPMRLGAITWGGRERRPVLLGLGAGLATGAAFVVGALIVRQIDVIAEPIGAVMQFANQGALPLVVAITLVNGVAEELFFRGALYTALEGARPVLISTLLYIVATLASGNPMLGFAAVVLGLICAVQRRATGGVLAPVLTHLVWGLIMVLALPPIFAGA
ncbi:abortive infection protein [Mycolicibacterium chitae]|uniref:Putative metal-dependent membrane protease n=1 Tax=Mycolicibacterium chitae TaxID=1792 RepID=A0A448I1T7_MYCCI|nr:CPBP family intramembrane glutamic endopeptidase [Mycolicibacterium chitae]MCV7106605.1 CPBP family intramembrane metalloprotease [Mycolicibacterium chitae]BBZ03152.1 abortive infection protein [Mycolicibacterium chitae]VEG46411.1 putative metal-dependent membrane protease [Mycolicibacterium chitae]